MPYKCLSTDNLSSLVLEGYNENIKYGKINQDCGHTNTFHATDLFLYPLKTSENLWFLLEGEGDPWH